MEQKDNFEMVINLRKAHDSKRPKKFKSAVNLIRGLYRGTLVQKSDSRSIST